jgi:hypothetical protein
LIITRGSKYSFQLPTKDSTPTVARIGRDNGIVICQNMRGASTKAAIELTSNVNTTVTKAMKAELPSSCQKRPLVAIET